MPPLPQRAERHSHQRAAHMPSFTGAVFGGLGSASRSADPLPEHEVRWPATDELRAAIEREWDGDSGTAHDLGRRFHNAAGESYPSWRIQNIARELDIYDERMSERIQANIAAIKADANARRRPLLVSQPPKQNIRMIAEIEMIEDEASEISPPLPEPEPEPEIPESEVSMPDNPPEAATAAPVKPKEPEKPRSYKTRQATCAGCGVTFTSTFYPSTGWVLYHSRECSILNRRSRKPAAEAEETERSQPAPESTPLPPAPSASEQEAVLQFNGKQMAREVITSITSADIQQGWGVEMWRSPRRQLRQALHTLVDALPDADTWSRDERSRWLEAVVGVLDFTIPAPPAFELDWRAAQ